MTRLHAEVHVFPNLLFALLINVVFLTTESERCKYNQEPRNCSKRDAARQGIHKQEPGRPSSRNDNGKNHEGCDVSASGGFVLFTNATKIN